MFESLFKAFIIYFVVINPIGNAPAFFAVTEAQDASRELLTALEGTAIATAITMFSPCAGPRFSAISTSLRPLSRSPAASSCSSSR